MQSPLTQGHAYRADDSADRRINQMSTSHVHEGVAYEVFGLNNLQSVNVVTVMWSVVTLLVGGQDMLFIHTVP
jgi:hypothetical protein